MRTWSALRIVGFRGIRAAALALVLLGALAPRAVTAATETYALDPEHTAISFSIRHFFSRVPGRFGKSEGTITLDPEDLTKGSVEVTIDAASIDTNEPSRDKHLRSDAFFDVEHHPRIVFKSTAVTQPTKGKLKVAGNLTIRGVTKPVTLDVDVLGFGEMYGAWRGAFEARTHINRQDFGVSWNDVVEGGGVVLGDDVDIVLNIEAIRQKPGAEKK